MIIHVATFLDWQLKSLHAGYFSSIQRLKHLFYGDLIFNKDYASFTVTIMSAICPLGVRKGGLNL